MLLKEVSVGSQKYCFANRRGCFLLWASFTPAEPPEHMRAAGMDTSVSALQTTNPGHDRSLTHLSFGAVS